MKISKNLLRKLIFEALSQEDIEFLEGPKTGKERRKAYKILARKYHPDKGGSDDDMTDLNSRYQALGGDEDNASGGASQQQPQGQTGGSRVDAFIRHFSNFNNIASDHQDIFDANNDLELTEIYGFFLLKKYNRNADVALQLYDTARNYVENANYEFTFDNISRLNYDDDYVRWKFRSMMYAKHATQINNNNVFEILKFAFYSSYEMLKIFQRTGNPNYKHLKGYIDAILSKLNRYDNYDRYGKQMNGVETLRDCNIMIDSLIRDYGIIFNQYNLGQKIKEMIVYNVLTKHGLRRM